MDQAKKLLSHNNKIGSINSTIEGLDRTPLQDAIVRKQDELVELLLQKDNILTNITCQGCRYTPLTLAIKKNNLFAIEQLLNHEDCDINRQDGHQQIPITSAYKKNCNQIVDLLLEKEALDIDQYSGNSKTLLKLAIENHDHQTMEKIFHHPNQNFQFISGDNWALLNTAFFTYDNDTIKLLIDNGININEKMDAIRNSRSIIFAAITDNNMSLARILLSRDDIDLETPWNGMSPFDYAFKYKRNEIAREILAHPNCKTDPKLVPLRGPGMVKT